MKKDFRIELGQPNITGIPGIDIQHSELFLMLDGFINSLKDDKLSPDITRAVIQEMFEHLRSHLFTEECLLDMVDFPKANEHKAQHKNIINMLRGEMEILKDTDNSKLSRFMRSYRHIGLTHIMVFDREYVDYIETLMTSKKKFPVYKYKDEQAAAG